MDIPKNIWIFWLQGFEVAPPLVQICVSSWEQKNADWTVHRLTEKNIRRYLDDEFVDRVLAVGLPAVKVSNIFRLKLIARYGGVWADADCYCTRPLDGWINGAADSGFFAFRFSSDEWLASKPSSAFHRYFGRTKDRILASWFLAGMPGNLICESFAKRHVDLFEQLTPVEKNISHLPLRKVIFRIFRRNAYLSSKLSDPKRLRFLRGYPYFIFHYHFANTVLTDPEFRSKWHQVPVYLAAEPLKYSMGLGAPVDQSFIDDMCGNGAGVYKFHWKLVESTNIDKQSRFQWLEAQTCPN